MAHATDYESARRRAKAKYGFFVHAVVYAAVMLLLVVINLLTSPEAIWFIWPLIGWGLAVALHGAQVYLLSEKEMIIDTLTDAELKKAGAADFDQDKS